MATKRVSREAQNAAHGLELASAIEQLSRIIVALAQLRDVLDVMLKRIEDEEDG